MKNISIRNIVYLYSTKFTLAWESLTDKAEANLNFKDKEEVRWNTCSVNLKSFLSSDMNFISYFNYRSQIVFYISEKKPPHCLLIVEFNRELIILLSILVNND